MLTFALGRAFGIIGEAASHVTNELRIQNSHIPWEDIIGMRNWMVHAYFDVDLDLVWETTTYDLPPLIADLEQLLAGLKKRVDRA